jgi:hypothetical protein
MTPVRESRQSRIYKAVTAGGTLAGAPPLTFTNTGAALRPYSPTAVGGGPVDLFGMAWSDQLATSDADRRRLVDFADVPLSEPSE